MHYGNGGAPKSHAGNVLASKEFITNSAKRFRDKTITVVGPQRTWENDPLGSRKGGAPATLLRFFITNSTNTRWQRCKQHAGSKHFVCCRPREKRLITPHVAVFSERNIIAVSSLRGPPLIHPRPRSLQELTYRNERKVANILIHFVYISYNHKKSLKYVLRDCV